MEVRKIFSDNRMMLLPIKNESIGRAWNLGLFSSWCLTMIGGTIGLFEQNVSRNEVNEPIPGIFTGRHRHIDEFPGRVSFKNLRFERYTYLKRFAITSIPCWPIMLLKAMGSLMFSASPELIWVETKIQMSSITWGTVGSLLAILAAGSMAAMIRGKEISYNVVTVKCEIKWIEKSTMDV